MINAAALQILHRCSQRLHVAATLPGGERICVRVTGVGSKVGGIRMDNGRLQEDIRPEWITRVSAY